MSEWKETILGDLIDVKHGFAFPGEYIKDLPCENILLTPGNFAIGGGFKGDKFKYYYGAVPEEFTLKEGDLLITMTDLSKQSDTLGYPAFVPCQDNKKFLHNQRLGKVILQDGAEIDIKYLYYLLCCQDYRHEILASATGTSIKHTSPDRIKRFQFNKPPLPEQKAIASILSSLDDKIELNRRMNETLEAMARGIFKDWFVDFVPTRAKQEGRAAYLPEHLWSLFPEAIDEETGLPMGWRISTIGEECTFLNGYAFKSKDLVDNPQNAYHIFKMGNIKRGGGFNYEGTKSYFPVEKAANLQKYLLHKGDILMSMTDMKSSMALLGHTALMSISNIFLLNQRVGRIRANESSVLNFPYLFLYSNLEETIDDLRSRANSGVQVNLSTEEIKKTPILVPDEKAHDLFNQISLKLFDLTFSNEKEVRTLAELRDRLLPKLMSGEIRVKDAEKIVEEVL